MSRECKHCARDIEFVDGQWIDPQAQGDDSIWREVCDSHDTFTAEHEPYPLFTVTLEDRSTVEVTVAAPNAERAGDIAREHYNLGYVPFTELDGRIDVLEVLDAAT